MNPKSEAFISAKAIKSERTAQEYANALQYILGNEQDSFLDKTKAEREQILLTYILKAVKELSPKTVRMRLAVVRSFCTWYDVNEINFKKLLSVIPKGRKFGTDSAPTIDEIRKLLAISDLRLRTVVLILKSSGSRIGGISGLNLRDFEDLEDIGKLTIYRGDAEEYESYIDSEALDTLKQYLAYRKKAGEKLTEDSPLIRADFDSNNPKSKVKNTNVNALSELICKRLNRAGLGERTFKQIHGFRKFFKSNLESTGMKSIFVERLLGHADGLNANYLRKELEAEYRKYQSALFIGEQYTIKSEVKEDQDKMSEELSKAKMDIVYLQSRILAQDEQIKQLVARYTNAKA